MKTKEAHATKQRAYNKTIAGRGTSARYFEKQVKPKLTPYQKLIIEVLKIGGRLVISPSLNIKPFGWHAELFDCNGLRWPGKVSMATAELLTTGAKDVTLTLLSIDVVNQKIAYFMKKAGEK